MVNNNCSLYVCHIFYSVVVNILSFTIKLTLIDSIVTNEQVTQLMKNLTIVC